MKHVIISRRDSLLLELKGWLLLAVNEPDIPNMMNKAKSYDINELRDAIQRISRLIMIIERRNPHEFPAGILALN
jgi:hypothetical protein